MVHQAATDPIISETLRALEADSAKLFFQKFTVIRETRKTYNRLSQEILGFTPKNDKEGVLQDWDWGGYSFGYFSSYCLGNMMAAQLWETVNKQIPNLQEQFSEGNFPRTLVLASIQYP